MNMLNLALKSLRNRWFSAGLSIFAIAISVALWLSVERTRRSAETSFTQAISQTDLLVGARTGPLNLLLYTVFNMGSASNNISWQSYQNFKRHLAVEWTIPYSLGDGHRGFRVVATDENFYEHYRFRGTHKVEFKSGSAALGLWDVVIGSKVENKLGYKLGEPVVLAHGVTRGEGVLLHDDKPFHVSGILQPTGTSIDESLYISLYGMEAIHMDWQSGSAPSEDQRVRAETIDAEKLQFGQITAFFLKTRNRLEVLRLQREINTYDEEPLLAVIPGVTLASLWQGVGQMDTAMKVVSWMVIASGLTGLLISLLATLNERRREMSILRSLGATPLNLAELLIFESGLITLGGIVLGILLQFAGFALVAAWVQQEFGLSLQESPLEFSDLLYFFTMLGLGIAIGGIPALQASRRSLKDGLQVRN